MKSLEILGLSSNTSESVIFGNVCKPLGQLWNLSKDISSTCSEVNLRKTSGQFGMFESLL